VQLIGNEHLDVTVAGDATGSTSFAYGGLHLLTVRLFQDDLTPTRETPLDVYEAAEADYPGYAAGNCSWGVPSRADDGTIEVLGVVPEFRPTDGSNPNTIFGLFSVLGDGSLGFAGRFDDAPFPMGDHLDQLTITLRFRPDNGGTVDLIS
jgi:hypothetical protein